MTVWWEIWVGAGCGE